MNPKRQEFVLWLLLAGAGPMMVGTASAAAPPGKAPTKGSPDADLLEFLGSLDSETTDGWHEYLENTDLDRVADRARTSPPAKPVPPAQGAASPPPTGVVKP